MEDGLPVVGERCPAQRGSAIPAVEGGGDVRKGPGHGVWKTGCSGAPTRFMRASVSGRSRDWRGPATTIRSRARPLPISTVQLADVLPHFFAVFPDIDAVAEHPRGERQRGPSFPRFRWPPIVATRRNACPRFPSGGSLGCVRAGCVRVAFRQAITALTATARSMRAPVRCATVSVLHPDFRILCQSSRY